MVAEPFYSLHSRKWLGRCLLLGSVSTYQIMRPQTYRPSHFSFSYLRPFIPLVKVPFRLPIQLKCFHSLIAVRVPLLFQRDCLLSKGLSFITLTSVPEVGMAWAVAVCLGFAAVLPITFPRMLIAMDSPGAFGFYA
jgi:hypothetical protein